MIPLALVTTLVVAAFTVVDGIGYSESQDGLPLLDGSVAAIECDKHGEMPGGDHTVFFGVVTGGSVTDRRPLLYYRGGYAGLSGA